MDFLPFIPGDESEDTRPLARFLPPVAGGVSAAFLDRHAITGEWVLDQIGRAHV